MEIRVLEIGILESKVLEIGILESKVLEIKISGREIFLCPIHVPIGFIDIPQIPHIRPRCCKSRFFPD